MRFVRFLDPFLLALLGAVILASFAPARGGAVPLLDAVVTVVIALLFFLYGVRLRTDEAVAAVTHWRLHSVIFGFTYVVFPLVGLALLALPESVLPRDLTHGLVFLTLLPSTVQASIAFVSIARGNIAGAIVAASASNLLGVILTPVLVALLLGSYAGVDAGAIVRIGGQILAPFILGQIARRWLIGWVTRHRRVTLFTDRSVVVLVVYSAFSQGVVAGIWSQVGVRDIVVMLVLSTVILALVLFATWSVSGWFGFTREDRITILMCGSKKSLATGVPIATVLFPAATLGFIMLPVMIFHQLQLVVCSIIATRMGRKADPISVQVP